MSQAPDARVYRGKRITQAGAAAVIFHDPPATPRPLPKRLDLRGHSPDGFQWGYSGSGPAQLALALCADATGDDELAIRIYQRFKEEILAPLQENEWAMAALSIREFAASLDIANKARA